MVIVQQWKKINIFTYLNNASDWGPIRFIERAETKGNKVKFFQHVRVRNMPGYLQFLIFIMSLS